MDTTDARSQLDHCSTQRSEVYDTVAYMSIPATIFLLPFAMFLEKPVPGQWPEVFGTEDATDWQILRQVMHIAPGTFSLFVLSGVSGPSELRAWLFEVSGSPSCRGAWEKLRMEGSWRALPSPSEVQHCPVQHRAHPVTAGIPSHARRRW